MKLSAALPLLAITAVAAFQPASRAPLAVTNKINSRSVAGSTSALFSATMDETSLEVVNGANGIKRKKTKKVSFNLVVDSVCVL